MEIIDAGLRFGSLSRRNSTNRIILHHAEASVSSPQQIHQWHLNNGWSGAGYHFLVRKDGSVYSLRPEWAIGAHASGANSDSIGVCFEGAYNRETMPEAQLNAGKELVAYLKNKYNITRVQPHRDVTSTDCPGHNFPFNEIAGASGNVSVSPAPSQPTQSGNFSEWVRRLQHECNVQGFSNQAEDGKPGPNTLAGSPQLGRSSRGNITALVQERLNSLGYNCGAVDGINGPNTQSGIKAFQRANGLAVDGIVGPNTWRKLLGL